MAAILSGFLPSRKKGHYTPEPIFNTRWGDIAITAPLSNRWSANSTQPHGSPEPDSAQPLTPIQSHDKLAGLNIVHDEEDPSHLSDVTSKALDRYNVASATSFSRPNKTSHSRTRSQPNNLFLTSNPSASSGIEMALPSLVTLQTTPPIPSPESQVSSPVARKMTTPVLSFRSRLADPKLADILSPVAEGFAKAGPSARPDLTSSSHDDADQPSGPVSKPSVLDSPIARRASWIAAYNSEGLGSTTMSSQVTAPRQMSESNMPPPKGIAATTHARAPFRRIRASSREGRSDSTEQAARRTRSVESSVRRAPVSEQTISTTSLIGHVKHGTPAVDPALPVPSIVRTMPRSSSATRRSTSKEVAGMRGQSVDHYTRGGKSVELFTRRGRSIEPILHRHDSDDDNNRVRPAIPIVPDLRPVRRRAPSIEVRAGSRRRPLVESTRQQDQVIGSDTPTLGLPDGNMHNLSRDLRGRRGASVEPGSRQRLHEQVISPIHNHVPRCNNDDSSESTGIKGDSQRPHPSPPSESEPDSMPNDATHKRRSIGAPIDPPTMTTLATVHTTIPPPPPPRPALLTNFDTLSSRECIVRPIITPIEKPQHPPPNRSQSRTRGVYADLQEDFSILAREVQSDKQAAELQADIDSLAATWHEFDVNDQITDKQYYGQQLNSDIDSSDGGNVKEVPEGTGEHEHNKRKVLVPDHEVIWG